MNIPDMTVILGNLSQSLYPIQTLISGASYIFGLLFFITAIQKLQKIGNKRMHSSSNENVYSPMMYLLMGAFLVYLPSTMSIMANTAFGSDSALSYIPHKRSNFMGVIELLVNTVGLLWFVRGCTLMAHGSEISGPIDEIKGFVFILSGIFLMNFLNTVAMLNNILNRFIKWTMSIGT